MTAVLDAHMAFSGTVAPKGADVLDEAKLTAWMEVNVDGFDGPLSQSKFAGGQSNPTYKISAPSGDYVLRRKPFGQLLPSAHAVDRGFKVQAGLHKMGFPVARQYGLCTDESVVGSWFYVMGMVNGRTIWNGAMPGSPPDTRRKTYDAMIDTLAALHSVDVEAADPVTCYGFGTSQGFAKDGVGDPGEGWAVLALQGRSHPHRGCARIARALEGKGAWDVKRLP